MRQKIFSYEMKLLTRDGVVFFVTLLFLGSMGYAGWLGKQYHQEQQAEITEYQMKYEESLAQAREEAMEHERQMVSEGLSLETYTTSRRNPYSVGSAMGKIITLQPEPFMAFSVGQSDLQPAALKVTVAGVQPAIPSATLESPYKLFVGHFDLSFVFLYMFPLLIIALMFGLTSSERESGLLRMLLAQPVRLTTLAEGKIAARVLILGACILSGTLAIWVITGGTLAQWGLWVLVAVVYGVFWVGLSVFVDSRVKAASTSALILAGCWLLFAVVVPALVSFFATSLYPVPSRMEYVTAMRTETTVAQQQGSASLAQFFEDHPEIAPVSDDDANYAMLRVAREEKIAEQLAPVVARFDEQLERQQALIGWIGYLSPTVLTHRAFMDIAGTGTDRYTRFKEEVNRFHGEWKSHFVPMYFQDTAFQSSDYDTLPLFSIEFLEEEKLASKLILPVGVIFLLGLVLWGLGFQKYRKIDLIH